MFYIDLNARQGFSNCGIYPSHVVELRKRGRFEWNDWFVAIVGKRRYFHRGVPIDHPLKSSMYVGKYGKWGGSDILQGGKYLYMEYTDGEESEEKNGLKKCELDVIDNEFRICEKAVLVYKSGRGLNDLMRKIVGMRLNGCIVKRDMHIKMEMMDEDMELIVEEVVGENLDSKGVWMVGRDTEIVVREWIGERVEMEEIFPPSYVGIFGQFRAAMEAKKRVIVDGLKGCRKMEFVGNGCRMMGMVMLHVSPVMIYSDNHLDSEKMLVNLFERFRERMCRHDRYCLVIENMDRIASGVDEVRNGLMYEGRFLLSGTLDRMILELEKWCMEKEIEMCVVGISKKGKEGYLRVELGKMSMEDMVWMAKRNKVDVEVSKFRWMDGKKTYREIERIIRGCEGGIDEEERGELEWGEIGGYEEVKRMIIQGIEWPDKYGGVLDRLGVRPMKGILMYGPSGCGKTSIVRAITRTSRVKFILMDGGEMYSMYVGESERRIREVFEEAKRERPSVIFFDEMDSIVGKRGRGKGEKRGQMWSEDIVQERILSTLLNEMDGIEKLEGVVVIGTTNRIDLIDDALLRPGRFDQVVYVPCPDVGARREIFSICKKRIPTEEREGLMEELVEWTEGWTGAECREMYREAGMVRLRIDPEGKMVMREDLMEGYRMVKERRDGFGEMMGEI